MKNMEALKIISSFVWDYLFLKDFGKVFDEMDYPSIFFQATRTPAGQKWLASSIGREYITWLNEGW